MNAPASERAEIPGERSTTIVAKRAAKLTRVAAGATFGVLVLGVTVALGAYYWSMRARAEPAPKPAPAASSGEFRLPQLVWPEPLRSASADAPADAEEEAVGSVAEDPLAGDGEADTRTALEPPPLRRGAGLAPRDARVTPLQREPEGVRGIVRSSPELAPVWYRPVAGDGGQPAAAAAARSAPERVAAHRLPQPAYWVPRGHALDCTLKTAIDSTLAGLATCVTATDLYGADGRLVLLERGSELVGRVETDLKPGQERVGVLWEDARTPGGVLVRLDSPATDALGRTGLAGDVDRRFGDRFGAALLLSVVDASLQYAANAQRDGDSTVVVDPRGTSDIATEVLRETVGIPPTIRVPPGARVQVLAARHLDFESVYRLARAAGE